MKQAEKEKITILVPNSVHTRPGDENSKKNSKKTQEIKKPLSNNIFRKNQIGREREKIILVPNSIHTRPGDENSEKKKKKKKQKFKNLKNPFLALFLAKTERDRLKKERKKFQSRIPFILDLGKKILKKIAKKVKKLKNFMLALFLSKPG